MTATPEAPPSAGPTDRRSYGQGGLSAVDRFGAWLSARAVARRLPQRDRLVVLDLGCGYEARLLRALQPRLAAGIGIDFHVGDVARGTERLRFVEGRIEEALPGIEASSVDAVLLVSVLEHVTDPLHVLAGAHRVLKPGGALIVNVPTWRGKRALELVTFRLGIGQAAEVDDHRMYYDLRDLWPLLVEAGFAPRSIRARRYKLGCNLLAVAHRS